MLTLTKPHSAYSEESDTTADGYLTESPPYSSSGYSIDNVEDTPEDYGVVESPVAEEESPVAENGTVAVDNGTAGIVSESEVDSGNESQVEGEAVSNGTSDDLITISQAEIVQDTLHDSTMLTTSTETEQVGLEELYA